MSPDETEASCLSALECGYRLINVAGCRFMEKAYKEDKVRAIGLSNFNVEQIRLRE